MARSKFSFIFLRSNICLCLMAPLKNILFHMSAHLCIFVYVEDFIYALRREAFILNVEAIKEQWFSLLLHVYSLLIIISNIYVSKWEEKRAQQHCKHSCSKSKYKTDEHINNGLLDDFECAAQTLGSYRSRFEKWNRFCVTKKRGKKTFQIV